MKLNLGEKLELVRRWRDADAALFAHTIEHPVCSFVGQRRGCPDWRRLDAAMQEIEARMLDAGMPSPNGDRYAGPDGADLYLADLLDEG